MRLIDADALIADWKADMEMPRAEDGTFELALAKEICKAYMDIVAEWPTANLENRYAWHDLRKNPEDLPEKHKWVLIHADDCEDSLETAKYFGKSSYDGNACWETSLWDYYDEHGHDYPKILAWRYIEPFEEGEE